MRSFRDENADMKIQILEVRRLVLNRPGVAVVGAVGVVTVGGVVKQARRKRDRQMEEVHSAALCRLWSS